MRERGPRVRVKGGGDVDLHVVLAGKSTGLPLVFMHGYCQSTYAWRKQFDSILARDFCLVAFDLRGHGASGKPETAEAYNNSQLWADDLAAVLDALELKEAVLVAWSYAGYVVGDYLRHHGSERVAALALVSALTRKGGEKARTFTGPEFAKLFPDLFSADDRVLRPAMGRFVDMCVADAAALSEHEREKLAAIGERVPAVAREAMSRRKLDNDDLLRTLAVPSLCIHGSADAIVLPASSEHNAKTIPSARLSLYEGIGHTPFVEDSERFERELRDLAARATEAKVR